MNEEVMGMKKCSLEKTLPGAEDILRQVAWLPAGHAIKGAVVSLSEEGRGWQHGWKIKEVYG